MLLLGVKMLLKAFYSGSYGALSGSVTCIISIKIENKAIFSF